MLSSSLSLLRMVFQQTAGCRRLPHDTAGYTPTTMLATIVYVNILEYSVKPQSNK